MALKSKYPERYPDIIAMYARGHANSLDILKADFVHWPPNGIDVVHAPDIDVNFRSIFSTSEGWKRLIPSFNSLMITTSLFKSHPIAATLFWAISTTARVAELGGFIDPARSNTTIFLNDFYRLFTFTQGGRRFLSQIITHEFKHIVQARDKQESLSSSLDNNRLGIASYLEDKPDEHVKYLSEECELQARLHTMMVGLYHQFEKLPSNRDEFYAALASQGINVPETFLSIAERTSQGREALSFYQRDDALFARYADTSAVKDLNKVFDALTPERKIKFWSRVMPFIYGDMLELYGDRLGHKRMGHSHNIQLREVFYRAGEEYRTQGKELEKKTIVTADELAAVKKHFDLALDVVRKMSRDDAVDLGCKILRGDLYHEYGKAACVTYRKGGLGEAAVKTIWSRADITSRDKTMMRMAAGGYDNDPDYSRPSLNGRGGIRKMQLVA
ncbi:MAG TPA: hypothetical protein PLF01_02190 [Alphaproteobacteria bacterium]|nr:hypothetical protein [Alphaproteobacteria bacterium]